MRLLAAHAMNQPDGIPDYRRITNLLAMYLEALEPIAGELGQQKFEELAVALATSMSFETYSVMKDVQQLNMQQLGRTWEVIVESLLEKYGVS
jgi:hypothetical protein